MEASRIVELLDEGKNANWVEYATGKSRKLMPVTFHLLCHKLIESGNCSCPSVDLTGYIAERMQSNGTPIPNPASNPGSHFTQEYSKFIKNKKLIFVRSGQKSCIVKVQKVLISMFLTENTLKTLVDILARKPHR